LLLRKGKDEGKERIWTANLHEGNMDGVGEHLAEHFAILTVWWVVHEELMYL
jgi:hypothetical protein